MESNNNPNKKENTGRLRNRQWNIWLTDEEFNFLEEKIQLIGLKKGAYARKILLEGKVIQIDMTPLRELNRKITGAVNNLNQIAKVANEKSFIPEPVIWEALNNVDTLLAETKEISQLLKQFKGA